MQVVEVSLDVAQPQTQSGGEQQDGEVRLPLGELRSTAASSRSTSSGSHAEGTLALLASRTVGIAALRSRGRMPRMNRYRRNSLTLDETQATVLGFQSVRV